MEQLGGIVGKPTNGLGTCRANGEKIAKGNIPYGVAVGILEADERFVAVFDPDGVTENKTLDFVWGIATDRCVDMECSCKGKLTLPIGISTDGYYADGECVTAIQDGEVYVRVTEDVKIGDEATIATDADTEDKGLTTKSLGVFGADSDWSCGTYTKSGKAGEIVPLRIDL